MYVCVCVCAYMHFFDSMLGDCLNVCSSLDAFVVYMCLCLWLFLCICVCVCVVSMVYFLCLIT